MKLEDNKDFSFFKKYEINKNKMISHDIIIYLFYFVQKKNVTNFVR